MGPVLELDIQVSPDHWPERLVVPRPHQIHDGTIASSRRSEFVHLDPVERFLFGVVEGHKTLWKVIMPPLAMRREKRVFHEQRFCFAQILLDNFETVVLWKTVVNTRNQLLRTIWLSSDFPPRGCFPAIVMK